MCDIKNINRYKEASPFFLKPWTDWTKSNGDWCNYEGFMMDFKEEYYIPFNEYNFGPNVPNPKSMWNTLDFEPNAGPLAYNSRDLENNLV